jgi:hypothetical protein
MELIRHMEEHNKAVYTGIKYVDSYMKSHDALAQMTDNAGSEWE